MTGTFACPFYRKDPFQHMDCVNYTLTRLSDVKQHLQRRHQDHLVIRCTVCNEAFNSFAEHDKHVNSSASCPNSPALECARFGPEQSPQPRLKTRSSRRVAPSEMYFDLWDTLFDKQTRPLNPYLGPVFLETIAALRDFWETEKSTIVPNIISEQPPLLAVDGQSLSTTLMNIFDRLQIRFEDRVRNRCSAGVARIRTPTAVMNKPKASLDVGEPYIDRFECYVDPTLSQGIEAFDNQLPNPGYPMSPVPQLHFQDSAAAANNQIHHILQTSKNSENDAGDEGENYQASGEASIGTFLPGDLNSEFPFDYSNLSYFDCL
ncbi:unnamed protein product [Clonostachys rosea f. rosea IK726]|uniref:Uncharacterized protein n=1 Tax=Clonostachys rosea f. rosea IK726 TaxID=1349383 RepID=A0ACA9UWN9_BIOOC|nr:unnamed protein product [Clonostachys rosea f. rosea IK726]